MKPCLAHVLLVKLDITYAGVDMRFVTVFIVLLMAILMRPATAQPKWAQGQIYSGNIDLGGVQLPLPSGEWTVTGFQSFASKTNMSGGTGGDTQTVALAQISGKTVRAYMVLGYNQRSMGNGWTVSDAAQCGRKEIHHTMIVRDRQLDKSCQYVNHVIYSVSSTSAQWWKDTIEYALKNGVAMPPVALVGGVVTSDRSNYISAHYYFNPMTVGFPAPQNSTWENNDWNTFDVANDAKKKAFIQSVIEWTEKARPLVEPGLAGKLKKGDGLDWPAAMQP